MIGGRSRDGGWCIPGVWRVCPLFFQALVYLFNVVISKANFRRQYQDIKPTCLWFWILFILIARETCIQATLEENWRQHSIKNIPLHKINSRGYRFAANHPRHLDFPHNSPIELSFWFLERFGKLKSDRHWSQPQRETDTKSRRETTTLMKLVQQFCSATSKAKLLSVV